MNGRPTIYEALRDKLQREPTHAELCEDVKRILTESMVERAAKGQMQHHQKRRRS